MPFHGPHHSTILVENHFWVFERPDERNPVSPHTDRARRVALLRNSCRNDHLIAITIAKFEIALRGPIVDLCEHFMKNL